MPLREINFDGIVGPSHNYAGLSLGNLASTRHAGAVSHPRAAALQGIEKMRANLGLGLVQGIFVPHPRPNRGWLSQLATDIEHADAGVAANAMSSSFMWAANAATVSPAPDTADGRCHLTVANLRSMPHRSHEWPDTLAQLEMAFADRNHFAVHGPIPTAFRDEGAANHMRLASGHDQRGVELFVYGVAGGPYPARQHIEASRAIARAHGLDPALTIFAEQSEEAIAAGAFHNDVVAVADGPLLFAHEKAFADRDWLIAECARLAPDFQLVEVSDAEVPLADAIASYLFNAQLVTPPNGQRTLILPVEAQDTPSVWQWVQRNIAGNGPIRRVHIVDVRESMANGGGPACLRLRVIADPATVDPRFLVDEHKLDRVAEIVSRHWPAAIQIEDLQRVELIAEVETARTMLADALGLAELASG
ncbi:MAG: N-succinylarginine dihydrolase [Sphingomicrobium sp.]